MITWTVRVMNTVTPYDIKTRSVVADTAQQAMVISDMEKDDYLAVSARFGGNDVNANHSASVNES